MFLMPASRARPRQQNAAVLIETLTANNSASLQTSQSWNRFSAIELEIVNLLPATAGQNMLLRVIILSGLQTGLNYLNSGYSSAEGGALAFQTTTTGIALNGGNSVGNTNPGLSAVARFVNPNSQTQKKVLTGTSCYVENGSQKAVVATIGGWWDLNSSAIIGAQIIMGSGNLTSGSVKVYGVF